MPQWRTRPEDILEQVQAELEREVADNPPFHQVTGISDELMGEHAREAILAFIEANLTSTNDITPETLIQIYIMGFVIGAKYGERRNTLPPD